MSAEGRAGRRDTGEGARGSRISNRLRALNLRAYGMLCVLVAIWIYFQAQTDGLFLSSGNMTNLLRQASLVAILAVGMVLVIVSGHIDLSAGSAVGLIAIIAADLQINHGVATVPTIALAILAGLGMGVWQGFWIAYAGVPSFVVTLAGLLMFRGIALVITKGFTFAPFEDSYLKVFQSFLEVGLSLALIVVVFLLYAAATTWERLRFSGVPSASTVVNTVAVVLIVGGACAYFAWVFADNRGMPVPILILGCIAGVLAFGARRTRFGRHLYAIGGNREAARLSGINIRRNTFFVFVLMGALYGVTGVLLGARLASAPPNAGFFMELDAIAAAVIGGTSLMGGVGTIGGALVGALLLQSIANGMSLQNIQSDYQLIVTGMLLIGAVYIDMVAKKRRSL